MRGKLRTNKCYLKYRGARKEKHFNTVFVIKLVSNQLTPAF
jgi:hypothetical protein